VDCLGQSAFVSSPLMLSTSCAIQATSNLALRNSLLNCWEALKCFHGHCSYVEPLAKALEAEKWSLVQPLLTSSYTGFGTSSLKEVFVSVQTILWVCHLVRLFLKFTVMGSRGVACTGCNRD
jgi:hypothetical protein